MISKAIPIIAALATACVLAHAPAYAQRAGNAPIDPRPADPAANLPSDTGVQTTLPSGAVTGAGQPQGTLPQPDDGAPGGVEQRARERRSGSAASGSDDPGTAGKPFGPQDRSKRRSRGGYDPY
jgi:hypothetical protein